MVSEPKEYPCRPALLENFDRVRRKLERAEASVQAGSLDQGQPLLLLFDELQEYDPDSAIHSYRVALYTKLLALAAGYGSKAASKTANAALFHDIGKTGIPLELLTKKGSLSGTEYRILRHHTVYGADMLLEERAVFAARLAFSHHEDYSGNRSYACPARQKGRIPEEVYILRIVDYFDAATGRGDRRPPLSPEAALQEMHDMQSHPDGPAFKQELLDVFTESVALIAYGKLASYRRNALAQHIQMSLQA